MEANLESGHFSLGCWGFSGKKGWAPVILLPTPRHFTAWPFLSPFPPNISAFCIHLGDLKAAEKPEAGSSSWSMGCPNSDEWHNLPHFSSLPSSFADQQPGHSACAPVRDLSRRLPSVMTELCHFRVDVLGLSFHGVQRHFYLENT